MDNRLAQHHARRMRWFTRWNAERNAPKPNEPAESEPRGPGRPAALDAEQARKLRALRAAGESVDDLCAHFGISRTTYYRTMDR